jgi:uncharacterized repeat protein (TIGR01451 family)
MLQSHPSEPQADSLPEIGSLEAVGTGRPGPEELDGPQSAAVVIHKKAPTEIRFGQPAMLEIVIRNVGQVTAEGVVVEDAIAEGTKLVRTNPEAEVVGGRVRWTLGSIAPGQEITVTEELLAVREGMVGSVATVTFQASAATRSRATRPLLELKHTGPQMVLAGQPVKFSIELTNAGSGAATNVLLQEDVPEGLKHSAGTELEYEVGTIPPGSTRRLELTLTAARPGPVVNLLRARADGGLEAEDQVELEVVAPQLAVALEGPEKRYLERKATYELTVANPGTADANNVELLCRLPEGLRFVSTNSAGLYDPNSRSIRWSLARLPAREMGKVQFTVIPQAIGQVAIQADAMADRGLSDKAEKTIEVQGIAALFFGLVDLTDPIEVNGQTRYEIHVVNQGTKAATNIQLVALVPPGMRPVAGDGQTSATIEGQQLVFEPLDQLPPKGEAKFYLTVDGLQAGDHRVAVRLTSDEIEEPVTKEESTRVYSDQ